MNNVLPGYIWCHCGIIVSMYIARRQCLYNGWSHQECTATHVYVPDSSSLENVNTDLNHIAKVTEYIQLPSHFYLSSPTSLSGIFHSPHFSPDSAYYLSCAHMQVSHPHWEVPDQVWHLPWSLWPRRPGRSAFTMHEIFKVGAVNIVLCVQ